MTNSTLIRALGNVAVKETKVKENQSARDIIKRILIKHENCAGMYDRIAASFSGGSVWDICERLYDYCRDNLPYYEESEEAQYVSSPYTILSRGYSDCKGYALFCGGILDALKRTGKKIDWHFRFANYDILSDEPGHVFIVVNLNGGEIWLDPVIDEFDFHKAYWDARDEYISVSRAAAIGRLSTMGAALPVAYNGNSMGVGDSNFIHFNEEQAGVLLPSIGYDSSLPYPFFGSYPKWLPQLQLTPTGRLCFWNFPKNFIHPTDGSLSSASKSTYVNHFTKDAIGADNCRIEFNSYIKNKKWNSAAGVWEVVSPWQPGIPLSLYVVNPAFSPNGVWQTVSIIQWIMENVQTYLNKYLRTPYNVVDSIAFGKSWREQIYDAIGNGKIVEFLGNINFLAQPVGKAGFWDKFYLVVPIVIAAAGTLITAGAATPALISAAALAITKKVVTAEAAKQDVILNSQGILNASNQQALAQQGEGMDLTTILVGLGMIAAVIFLYE